MRKWFLVLALTAIGGIAFTAAPAMASHRLRAAATTQPTKHHHKKLKEHKHKKHNKQTASPTST